MALFTTHAIVTHSFNYGESDKIVTFFTKDFGKVKGIAKGARRSKKRFQNALDLFSHLRLIFFDREGMGLVRVSGMRYPEFLSQDQGESQEDHLWKLFSGDGERDGGGTGGPSRGL